MKTTLKIIAVLFVNILFIFNANGQTLLMPTELVKAYHLNDSSINTMLFERGYTLQHEQNINGEKTSTWHFQVRAGEVSDIFLLKITSPQKKEVRYWIMNPFFFKQFMDSVIKENYKFTGVKIIGRENYFVFKNDGKQLFISQKRITGKEDDYFEVMVNE